MKLCILEAGLPPEDLRAAHGTYPQMVERWLSPNLPSARFSAVSAVEGEALPEAADFDGYLITGSRHGVYEGLPWMQTLERFLLWTRDARLPVFGICFGHQIMAEAYGGRVEKSHAGWQVGAQAYRCDPGSGLASGVSLAFHQDQVTRLPKRARCIAANEHCPVAAITYDFPALSVQYHPEFDESYVHALLNLREGTLLPEGTTRAARDSMAGKLVDNTQVAEWAARFFERTIGTSPSESHAVSQS